MVLMKRVSRMLKKDFFKYFAVMLIVILGMAVVVGYGNTSFCTKETIDQYWERTNVEDGEFTTYVPLTENNIKTIEKKGFSVQKTFYFDISLEDDITLRIFKCRQNINKEDIQEGSTDDLSNDEIRLEKMFMKDNGINIGDTVTVDEKNYKINCSVTVPDYCHRVAEISNVGTDEKFGLAFVTDETYNTLLKGREADEIFNYTYTVNSGNLEEQQDELYEYLIELPVDESNIKDVYVKEKIEDINEIKKELSDGFIELKDGANEISDNALKIKSSMGGTVDALDALSKGAKSIASGISEMDESTSEILDELLEWEYPNLYRFNNATTNTRIVDFVQSHQMFFSLAVILGVLIALLIAYVISVFASNTIKNDHKIIGTLYAMGYRKKELIKLYLMIPIIVVAIGAIIGTFLGFVITDFCITANYSTPKMIDTYPMIFIVYGIIMPILVTAIINYFIINSKLNHSALEIMQNKVNEKYQPDEKIVKSKNKNFLNLFRNNKYKKEFRSHLILFFGISLSIIIMMLGISLYGSITHYAECIDEDTNFEYMYSLTNPLEEQPDDSEIAYSKYLSMYCDMSGSDMPVVIQGIKKDNPYYKFSNELTTDENMIYVSDSAVVKFGCKKGDKLIFTDTLNHKDYVFTVAGEVSFKNGIYFFMNIDNMRDYFGSEDDYYNTLLSSKELDINPNMLISVTTKKTIVETAESWVTDTMSTIEMFIIMAIIIFILVTFILIKNILESSVYQISLLKIMGYRQKELNHIYLNPTLITVVFSMIIMFPIGSILMEMLIPMVNASMKSGMASYIDPLSYVFMAGLILLSYFAAYLLLQRKLAKIEANEILKDRE